MRYGPRSSRLHESAAGACGGRSVRRLFSLQSRTTSVDARRQENLPMSSTDITTPMNLTALHGALLIDKPEGITSAKVLRRLERLIPGIKLGHAGTLDPLATGLLVVLVGKGSRLQEIFLGGNKEYTGTIVVGRETSSDDVTGETTNQDDEQRWLRAGPLSEQLAGVRAQFMGTIRQRPPAVSAIKIAGERSYRRARRGEEVIPDERDVTVHELKLTAIGSDRIEYAVRCSKGFYVRSLARDVGRALGSFGCLESIRRTRSDPFSVGDAMPLEELLERGPDEFARRVMPMAALTEGLPRLTLRDDECADLLRGIQQPLMGRAVEAAAGRVVALFDDGGEFRGLLEREGAQLRIRFLMAREG